MPLSATDHLELPAKALTKMGAFDPILDVDSHLFIDPLLLRTSSVREFNDAKRLIDEHLNAVLLLLKASRRRGDVAWRSAAGRLVFRELKGTCIGYSRRGTSGSGVGPGLRDRLLGTAKEIVDAGIQDPALFDLMGLLEEGMGPDRISDMFARIVVDPIYAFSHRVFDELGVSGTGYRRRDSTYSIPKNPFNNAPILLLPRDVLRDLPVAESWSDIEYAIAENAQLRHRVNELIGGSWREARHWTKGRLRDLLLGHPDLLRDLLRVYRESQPRPYNFEADPRGQYQWYLASRVAAQDHPLRLVLPERPTAAEVFAVFRHIAEHFKDLIENHGLWKLLYYGDKPRPEEAAQLLFFGIADAYCRANDLDLSPESDGGRGPVDFKVSRGYAGRAIAETKLSTNNHLHHGYETQVRVYETAERTRESLMIVLDVGGSRRRLETLRNKVATNAAGGKNRPDVLFVDARPRPSASRA